MKIKEIYSNKFTKFILLVLILFVYTLLMSLKYGLEAGPLVSFTTWSFFVFCTPIADAGFLIDFPVRLLTGFRMFFTEIIVWIIGAVITSYALFFKPEIFNDTIILKLYYQIITNLFPYGIIIILSAIGTFFSIHFGDEIYDLSVNTINREKDESKKKNKILEILFFIILIVIILLLYYVILKKLNISINLL